MVEGEVTEKVYLEALRRALGLSKDLVEIEAGKYTDLPSMAREMEREQNRRRKEQTFKEVDEWWVVGDTEGMYDGLPELFEYCRKKGIHLAVSDPAIEFWLLLHFEYTTRPFNDADAVISQLGRHLPDYAGKKRPDMGILLPRIQEAVSNGRRLRDDEYAAVDGPPRTDMDLLVRSMVSGASQQELLPEGYGPVEWTMFALAHHGRR